MLRGARPGVFRACVKSSFHAKRSKRRLRESAPAQEIYDLVLRFEQPVVSFEDMVDELESRFKGRKGLIKGLKAVCGRRFVAVYGHGDMKVGRQELLSNVYQDLSHFRSDRRQLSPLIGCLATVTRSCLFKGLPDVRGGALSASKLV